MVKQDIKVPTHPVFDKNREEWTHRWLAYRGGREFIEYPGHLARFRAESEAGYQTRIERAHYMNFCKPVVDAYQNFVFEEAIPISPPPGNPEWFTQAVEAMGPDEFRRKAFTTLNVFGNVYGTVTDQGFRVLTPLEVFDWGGDLSDPSWVVVGVPHTPPRSPLQPAEDAVWRYLVLLPGAWRLIAEDGKTVVAEAETTLLRPAFVSVAAVSKDPSGLGVSLIEDIWRINKAVFNYCSLLDQILYEQTFSVLTLPESAEDATTLVSTTRALTYPDNAQPPRWIAPPGEPAVVILRAIDMLVDEIYRAASLFRPQQLAQSGVAKAYDMRETSTRVAARAANMEEFENKAFRLLAEWHGDRRGTEHVYSAYPRQFDLLALEAELARLRDVLALDFPPAMAQYLKERLSRRLAAAAEPEQMQAILAQLRSE